MPTQDVTTATAELTSHKVVSEQEWVEARKALLEKEKQYTRMRDELSLQRRQLPWVKVEKNYAFDGPNGKQTLADLFDGRSQLAIYHFMLGPGWEQGCQSCSFLADHFDGLIPHVNARDLTFAVVSRAPIDEIQSFQKRMGWNFKWLSSNKNSFNFDYHVSATPEGVKSGKTYYNFQETKSPSEEMPGLSVFYKNPDGEIFHTYSAYARGLEDMISAYMIIDYSPRGRHEEGLSYPMAWVRHHDRYEEKPDVDQIRPAGDRS